ncbi:MAG: hypothetical protein WCT14_09040, partial [Treponemataceae bacterium]
MGNKIKVTVIGAGGKMGTRTTNNLVKHVDRIELRFCENSEAGIESIRKRGYDITPTEKAVPSA